MVTAIRALIMLTVLVGLPAAWVYYGPLPARAQQAVDRFVATAKRALDWEKLSGRAGEPSIETLEAPRVTTATSAATAPAFTPASAKAPAAIAAASSAPGTATLAAQVEPLLAKLRELGVEEYALEPWGGARQMYRFRCEMPVGGNTQITEQFEAVAADPQASIAQVVADVASWHAGRGAGMMR